MPCSSQIPKTVRLPALVEPLPRRIQIDRLADLLLSYSRTVQAERLSFQAEAMREATAR
jgi:hypothetical protein